MQNGILLPLGWPCLFFMKKLKEIVRVVGRKRLKRIEVFNEGGKSSRNSLYYKLYKGIKDGRFNTDEEAARELFGCEPTDKKYLMLKSRVKARLMNTMFFLEKPASRYHQALSDTQRNLVNAKLLLSNGARMTGLALLRSTLSEAEKFHITDVALDCLRYLRLQSAFLGKKSDYGKYNHRFKEVQEVLAAEWKAEEYFQLVSMPYAKSYGVKEEHILQATEYVEEIQALMETCNSYNLELYFHRLVVLKHQLSFDYRSMYEASSNAELFLNRFKEAAPAVQYGEVAFFKIIALMHLRDFEQGNRVAEAGLSKFTEGSTNWMIYLEYYFLLCMHTGNYQKAIYLYEKVTEHPRFEHADENRVEKWRIFGGFLKYFRGNLENDKEKGLSTSSRFNIWKFLNEVPIYSKDKRGLNISILILQVLFLLDRQDYDGIISRAEALKVYCSRYLKQDEHFRSNCFLKMLLIMEKKDFDRVQTQKIAAKYFNKLKSNQLQYRSGNLSTLEIIPYETLWDSILAKLKV